MKYGIWLLFWAFLFAVTAAIFGGQCVDYYRLERNGTRTQGTVLAYKAHGQIEYSFVFNGQTYRNVGMRPTAAALSESTGPGATLPVWFLPASPQISCVISPRQLFSNECSSVLLASAMFPTVIVFVIALRVAGNRHS